MAKKDINSLRAEIHQLIAQRQALEAEWLFLANIVLNKEQKKSFAELNKQISSLDDKIKKLRQEIFNLASKMGNN